MTATSRSSAYASTPALRYRDLETAVDWLCATFNFEVHSMVRGKDGILDYAELSFANDTLLLGSARTDEADGVTAQSEELGSTEIQTCYLLVDDLDALRAKATQANLDIVFDLKVDKIFGRSVGYRDLEGNVWYFGCSTSARTRGQPQHEAGARSVTGLGSVLVVLTIGFFGWLYVYADGVVGRTMIPGDESARKLRGGLAKGASVELHPAQAANEFASQLEKKPESLDRREAAVSLAKPKMAAQTKADYLAEHSAYEPTTTIQRERAQRKQRAMDERNKPQSAGPRTSKIDEPNAKLKLKLEHLPKSDALQQVRSRHVIKDRERAFVEQLATNETTKLVVKEKMPRVEAQKPAHRAAVTITQRTRLPTAKEPERQIALQSSVINQAAAIAVGTVDRTGSLIPPGSSPGDTNMVTDLVTQERSAELPIVIDELAIPSTKSEPDKTAKATLLQSRRKATAPPSLPRLHLRMPKVQEALAPSARRENSKAIQNARRLADKLRNRQAKSQLADKQRESANNGDPTISKAIEPEEILRRAFIAKW